MSKLNNPKPVPSWFSISNLAIGFCIGMAVCAAVMIYVPKNYPKITEVLHGIYYMVFGAALLIFIVIVGFKPYVQRFILNRAPNKVRGVIEDIQNVSDHVAIQLLNLLPNPPSEDIKTRAQAILPGLTNLLIWSRLRNWWWQWILGIFVAIGGLMGTILLMNQNDLLEKQNGKIDNQNDLVNLQIQLEESSRRSGAMNALLSSVMDKVDREIAFQKEGKSESEQSEKLFKLSESLIGQIIAVTHSFIPYRYLAGDTDTLISQKLSPERGHLLIFLSNLPLHDETINKIFKSGSFRAADLSGYRLSEAYLRKLDLRNSNLIDAKLMGADLREAILIDADLRGANLSLANLREADLTTANFRGAQFSGANLEMALFIESDLRGSVLCFADLTNANFIGTNLIGADLTSANLYGSDFSDVKWTIKQASKVKTLFNCEVHDSIRTVLSKTHPQLFESPKE